MMDKNDYFKAFNERADEWFKNTAFVKEFHEFFKDFFTKENLGKIEWKDIQNLGDHLHSANTNALAKKRAFGNPNHPIEHYRSSFLFLVYGEGDIESRVEKMLKDKAYRLFGIADSMISELIAQVFPEKYVIYNSRSREALRLLNIKIEIKDTGSQVDELFSFNEQIKGFRDEYLEVVGSKTDVPINLELDQFFSFIYENYSDSTSIEAESDKKINHWIIAPGATAEFWSDWLDHEHISLGWGKVGDLSKFSTLEEIRKRYDDVFKPEKNPTNDTLALYDFIHTMKEGDIVFVKSGVKKLLGVGRIISNYYFMPEKDHANARKVVWLSTGEWQLEDEDRFPVKALTSISNNDFIQRLLNLAKINNDEKSSGNHMTKENFRPFSKNTILFGPPGTGKTHELRRLQKKYIGRKEKTEDRLKEFISNLNWWEVIAVTLADIGKEVSVAELQEHKFIKEKVSQSKLDRARPSNVLWSNLQSHSSEDSKTVNVAKKHGVLIFDKTSDAKWHLVDNWKEQVNELSVEFEQYKKGQYKASNDKRFAFVTFHQSYSYEDFIEGIRPKLDEESTEVEYEIKKGVFREICELAENHPDEEFAIFIDEINRGNISKIFGELITLIETDKRISASDPSKGMRVTLPYSRIEFGVPENLYIIGTMNSVDRSVALVDMALRRRFEFQSVRPKVERVDENRNIKEVDLKKIFQNLNNKITVLLGNEYVIGHSYFMNENVKDLMTFKSTWFNKILPLLQEYFFDDWKKIKALVKEFVNEETVNGLEDLSLPHEGKLFSFKTIDVGDKDFITMLKGLE